jgi:tetratricopeptide (TPR) repeat protein
MIFLTGAALCARPALAADVLKFSPAPAWVVPQTIPDTATKAANAPAAILLSDQQIQLLPGKITSFAEVAVKLQTPEGLSAGNIAFPWNPAFDAVTVNKLHIIRGGKVIDVLAAGQTFTVARRETNLDAATLDGTLTAALQPEDLQAGDIVDFAVTIEHSDPTLKNHVESGFATWNSVPVELAHSRIVWPASMKLVTSLPQATSAGRQFTENGHDVFEITARALEPIVPPKSAPLRFRIGRLGEVSDFQSWADLADLFRPLFEAAAVVPSSGPLRDEVENIRREAHTPQERARLALQLVENRVRYVDLAMGTGGLVPASAAMTWARRFGDCKAKTALLLALLHELGIDAEPVLAHHRMGDALSGLVPMVGNFDHVLVRAHLGAKDYWLDGTRTGDTDLDSIRVPDLGWVLPLTAKASLVHLVPPPLTKPSLERRIDIDASAGLYAPVNVSVEEIYRDDTAVALNTLYSALSSDQRDEALRSEAKGFLDSFSVNSSSVQYDKDKRELNLTIKGSAKLNWKDGWSFVPTSTVGFNPDFDRAPGSLHDVPVAISYPDFSKDIATIRLPAGVAGNQKLSPAVHEKLAGSEYDRSETVTGDVLTVESSARSLMSEVPYKEAVAAAPRIKALYNDDVYLRIPDGYRLTAADQPGLAGEVLSSAGEYINRGNTYLNNSKFDEAIADFTAALKLDPNNNTALTDRGLGFVWKREFDQAEKDLSAALSRDPDHTVALRAEGLMAELKGDCIKAVDLYSRSLAKEPDNSFALGHRANCETALSKFNAALADSEQALRVDPTWLDLRLMRANIFVLQNNRAAATREAELAVSEAPHSQSALVIAGKVYGRLGMNKEAMAEFDRALAIKPSADIFLTRAQFRPAFEKVERMADIDEALKLSPNDSDTLLAKGYYLTEAGQFAEALRYYDRAVKSDHSVDTGANRAVALYKLGRTAEAEKVFSGLRTQAKTAVELNDLCWIKATAGILLDSALEECRDALQMRPDTGPFLDSLGMVLLKLGKTDEALDAYNKAIAKNVGADSLMGRAFVYLHKGERASAETDAAAARKVSPNIDEVFANYGLRWDDVAAAHQKPGQPQASNR